MEIALTPLLLDDPVDDVLGAAQQYLTLQQNLQVAELTEHLKHVNAHIVLLHLWLLREHSEHFSKVPHVDTPFVEKVFQALRVDRDALLLLEILDQVRDGLIIDERSQVLNILFLFGKLFSCHVQMSVLLEDIGIESVFGRFGN